MRKDYPYPWGNFHGLGGNQEPNGNGWGDGHGYGTFGGKSWQPACRFDDDRVQELYEEER